MNLSPDTSETLWNGLGAFSRSRCTSCLRPAWPGRRRRDAAVDIKLRSQQYRFVALRLRSFLPLAFTPGRIYYARRTCRVRVSLILRYCTGANSSASNTSTPTGISRVGRTFRVFGMLVGLRLHFVLYAFTIRMMINSNIIFIHVIILQICCYLLFINLFLGIEL